MLFTLLAVLLLGSAAKAQTIRYVTPTGANPTTGNKWEVSGITDKQILTLPEALAKANAGDQIWLLGFEQITSADQLYVAPEGGFTVKSGVKLYGGFRGTERTIDERPTLGKVPYFTYRSVLSGDINRDDKVDEINYVYPTNTTRSDNAKHVLSLNMEPTEISGNINTYPTVVNGFTVIGGNATDFGGGIYVYGSNAGGGAYQIEKCFLLNNYAAQGGGAIYVAPAVAKAMTDSKIVDCVVYNNLAGVRSGAENLGGGIRIDGVGTIVNSSIFNNEGGGVLLSAGAKAVNLTIARNTVMGIGAADGVTSQVVFNSVIWGNSKVQDPASADIFHNCASDNATIAEGDKCFAISSESNGANGPLFEAPSVFTSFDRDFDWRRTAYPTWSWGILEGSALIDKGNDGAYTGLPSTDLAGETRKKGTIDIGAYEYQHLDAGRIRYVKVGGTGDGSSWDKASGDLQKMIDELATIDAPGEVWVAAGTYRPTTQIIEGVQYAASFRMRDGIDVYGGFDDDEHPEDSKSKRKKGTMPWIYTNETILLGADYEDGSATWGNDQWNVISSSRHVVWFAPMSGEDNFKSVTILDGVTIKGGAANGGEGLADFATDKGGGVYMGLNAILQNCIVTENTANGDGGGVYANGDGADASSANAKGGRVVGCLVYNNSSVEDGGGVFVKNAGLVLRSMITNNSAMNGAGVYLDKNAKNHPEYLILSTSVVSNNTATGNGAVYCNESGVLLQNTIVNNDCPSTVDASNPNSSQTGGLYINKYAYVINSILWNNLINGLNIPMYALGAAADKVRFYNNAISGSSNAVWNNIYQTSTLKLSDENSKEKALSPDFKPGYPAEKPNDEPEKVLPGVQSSWVPTYYWEPQQGSNLRAGGLTIGTFPDNVLVAPELDIAGTAFAQKPAVGAHAVDANGIRFNYDESNKYYDVFVDIDYMETDGTGISWVQPYKSLNEVLAYFANDPKLNLTKETVVRVHVKEGDYWPRYAFTNLDPKTATLSIPALPNGARFEIYGGYAAESGNKEGEDDDKNLDLRFPTTYRTIIDGNHEGKDIKEGIYHCITVETGANVLLDGFHVINGYAAGTATLRYGAGMLVRDGATVEVRNSIFENNTAAESAAIDARGATLSLINCVVNNNTNTNVSGAAVVNAPSLTVNHVSVVNNVGAGLGAGNNSFAAGNSSNNSHSFTVDTNTFVNPTKNPGATLGFDTYLGGYSSFMPTGMNPVVNEGKNSDEQFDITFGTRSLGGAPDLGAYEAQLPVDGTVIYVRKGATGTGSSWNDALGSIGAALGKATSGQEIWVSAGTYTENLTMVEGVDVLGGFAATGNPNNELDGTNRDISNKVEKFKTVIQGAEQFKFIPQQQNVDNYQNTNKRVLTQPNNFDTQTTWEGFIITGGQTGLAEYGAGAKLMQNGRLLNCRIEGNKFYECGTVVYEERDWGWQPRKTYCSHSSNNHTGGGGVFCAGGIVENCQIVNNILDGYEFNYSPSWNTRYRTTDSSIYGKGAGLSISGGNIINCVIAQNVAGYDPTLNPNPDGGALTNILGAAAFVQSQSNFYSSTIVENTGGWSGMNRPIIPGIWDESLASGDGSYFYNCIIAGNYGYGDTKENFMQIGKGLNQAPKNLKYSYFTLVKFSDGSQSPAKAALDADTYNKYSDFGSNYTSGDVSRYVEAYKALNLLTADFDLNIQNGTHPCLNTGSEEYLSYGGDKYIELDANGHRRVQDCALDMGAYESSNEENILPQETINKPVGSSITYRELTYYVANSGKGLANGSSPDHVACAEKLQLILNHAGDEVKKSNENTVVTATVKVAGYTDEKLSYHPITLSDEEDPQSYTFVVPYGVTLMGGYDADDTNWDSEDRDVTTYKTILSAVSDDGVTGYHAVTFGDPAEGQSGLSTIIDGVTLTGGKATSMVGNGDPRTQGGGARVPSWGHIRNCRVYGNEAIQGGGLYLQPGALVSGTAVQSNSAEEGGGIYASIPQPTEEGEIPTFEPAHVVSSTVTDNTATENAGGIYFADGGALFLNMVVWNNTASSDNNISGPVYSTFTDSKMAAASAANGNNFTNFFPFNYSFVERFELPSNMLNTAMTSDEDLYFAGPDRTLRAFSPLVNNGYSATLQGYLETSWNIAKNDMQGIPRIQDNINKIDVGAYAFLGGVIPDPKIEKLTKLFVNQTTDFRVADDVDLDKVVGRSFYTPLYHLDDALEYVRKAREAGIDDEIEIFVAQGTYKPTIRRTDASTPTENQRQNSFVVPAGVKIYGGFIGDELYSSIASVQGESGELTLNPTFNTEAALAGRATTDYNQNGISEPWELTNQTILSGQVNASETVKNAYHVLYSDTKYGTEDAVTLDGLTVMDGETASTLSPMGDDNEVGRGGGLYSSGVDYILNRCRFLNNKGIRGNAAYVRNATATVIGSIFAGNSTVETSETDRVAGGALCLAADEGETAVLKAVNTLWANNETTGNGGAIGYAVNETGSTSVNLMNNTIVRNKALNNGAIYAQAGTVTNTLVWGNEGKGDNMSGVTATYSAAEDLKATNGNNIKLAAANTSIDGPRFAQPSDAAGAAANDPMTKWNPSSINVLTDAGNGVLAAGKNIDAIGEATGAYKDWWTDNENPDWTNAVDNYATKFMRTDDGNSYYRYTGPRDENGQPLDRTIDIGLYEYQYVTSFSKLDAVYVATTESGNGTGESWADATSDLRGAIIAMANPTGGKEDKAIYIRDGEYASKQLLTGTAFPLNMDAKTGDATYVNSLTIKGSYNEANKQDFSKPTVITSYSGVETQRLMNIATNGKPVFIEGIMFNNPSEDSQGEWKGNAIEGTGDNLTLGNVAFRGNAGTGVVLGTQGENPSVGNALIYNTLFADGGTGLDIVNGGATVVNATFANNVTAINGTASVFNSVSWKSGEDLDENFVNDDNTANKNNAVLGNAVNDNIQNGPNFVDPNNENILLRDYRIRPSMMLLNKGNDAHYKQYVEDVVVEGINYVDVDDPKRPKHQYDLANVTRKVGTIDIGAYEYAAPLSQILYVKSGVVGSDESGESWTNAISDLQGAINLASIYANVNKGQTGYVFVHNNVAANNVRVAMPNVKAYGSMNDETETGVSDILGKRSLDMERRSKINGLTVAGTGSVVDGFEVSGTVAVSSGMLSTSIVKPTDATGVTGAVSVTEKGVLYNSFVEGAVNKPETVNGKAVNVTATGAINVSDDINNNPNATENGYVSVDYWKYQLKDDSGLIDKTGAIDIADYMAMAGHDKDISGSSRIRNTVDFGCFETWNITANTEITATDKPSRNHVVYVRNGAELKIAKDVYTGEATAFNPGFLLLENGSGLLANGNYVGLTNFAMERTVPAGGTALTYVPFLIDKMDNASGATFQRYNGAKRAGYDYQYNATDGAWEPVTNPATAVGGVQAFAINGSAGAKVRFYGTSYKETPNDVKTVQLMKFNFNDPWTTNADGTINPDKSNRFTHKENMSWNMFGSPYLHAMNYKDMEYGRVIYTGASYETKNTADDTTTGSVAMGEGVFTQTATLQDYETFTVAAPTAGSDPQGLRGLLVTVAPADAEEADDFIQLKAVESEEASSEFNIAADGVKWMSDNASVAQIYMARNGGRYSMLSALDINGAVSLGLTIPQAAAYTIAIDEEAWMDEYETVVLEDKTTGQMVDLLEGAYQFQAAEAGTVEDRFSIRFNRIVDGLGDNVKAYSPSAGMIRVEGAVAGSLVRIYDLNGRCIRVGETSVVNYDVNVGPKGIYLVEVQQKEAEPVVKKVQVK